jgi:hypothetical protein
VAGSPSTVVKRRSLTMWFDLKGDDRLGRCASEGCGGQPTFRLEAGGVGSNYCGGCRAKIEADEHQRVVTAFKGWATDALARHADGTCSSGASAAPQEE